MKSYKKVVRDGYILCVAFGENGEEITENEYNSLLDVIQSMPIAPDGYEYKLRADTLAWELHELPPASDPSEDDIDDAEAFDIIFGGAE